MSSDTRVHIINSLRAIAALMVCVFHFLWHEDPSGPILPEGNVVKEIGYWGHHGVNVFFVISGFVIPLAMFYGKYKPEYFTRFIAKRMVRLHPPFIASMLLYAIMEYMYWLKGGYTIVYDWSRIAHNFFLTARIFNESWFQDVYWTLAIELQYYLIIALLYPLIVHNKRIISLTTIMLLIASAYLFGHDQKQYFFFHAPVFALGIIVFLHHIKKISLYDAALLAVFALWVAYYEISPACTIAAALTACCIIFVQWRSRWLEWTGHLSYSLYLTHAFSGGQFLYYTSQYAVTYLQKFLLLTAAIMLSIFFAYLFYRIIEVPSVRWSQRIKYHKPQ